MHHPGFSEFEITFNWLYPELRIHFDGYQSKVLVVSVRVSKPSFDIYLPWSAVNFFISQRVKKEPRVMEILHCVVTLL